jgi:hypothetical protein
MIAERHGLGVHTFSRLPSIGVFNAIYLLDDDLVLDASTSIAMRSSVGM